MIRTSSILLLTLLTLMSCKVVDENSNNNTQTLKTFQITNGEIQGWSFESGWEWQSFNAINMDTKVDGDCEYFIKGGLLLGLHKKYRMTKAIQWKKVKYG